MGDALYRGYVYGLKKAFRQRWKRVYCVVYERSVQGVARIEIYRTEDDFWKSNRGQHVVLQDVIYVREITPDHMGHKIHCAFAVKTQQHELHFGVQSTLVLQQWVAAISKAAFSTSFNPGRSNRAYSDDSGPGSPNGNDTDYEEPWDVQDTRVEVVENLVTKQIGLIGHYDMSISEKGISLRIGRSPCQAWEFFEISRTGASSQAFFFQTRNGDEFEFNCVNPDRILCRLRTYLPLSREIMTSEILARIHANLNNFYPAVFKVLQTVHRTEKTTSLTSIPSVSVTDLSSEVFHRPGSPTPVPALPPRQWRAGSMDNQAAATTDDRSVVSHDPGGVVRRQSSFSRYKSPQLQATTTPLESRVSKEHLVDDWERPVSPTLTNRLTRLFSRKGVDKRHSAAADESSADATSESLPEEKQRHWFFRGLLRTSKKKNKPDQLRPPSDYLNRSFEHPSDAKFSENPQWRNVENQLSANHDTDLEQEPQRPGLKKPVPPPVPPKSQLLLDRIRNSPNKYSYPAMGGEQSEDSTPKCSKYDLDMTPEKVPQGSANVEYGIIQKPRRPNQLGKITQEEILARFKQMNPDYGTKAEKPDPRSLEPQLPPVVFQPVPAPRVSMRKKKTSAPRAESEDFADMVVVQFRSQSNEVPQRQQGFQKADAQREQELQQVDAQRQQRFQTIDAQRQQGIQATDGQRQQGIRTIDAQRPQGLEAIDAQRQQRFQTIDAQRQQGVQQVDAHRQERFQTIDAQRQQGLQQDQEGQDDAEGQEGIQLIDEQQKQGFQPSVVQRQVELRYKERRRQPELRSSEAHQQQGLQRIEIKRQDGFQTEVQHKQEVQQWQDGVKRQQGIQSNDVQRQQLQRSDVQQGGLQQHDTERQQGHQNNDTQQQQGLQSNELQRQQGHQNNDTQRQQGLQSNELQRQQGHQSNDTQRQQGLQSNELQRQPALPYRRASNQDEAKTGIVSNRRVHPTKDKRPASTISISTDV